MDIFTDDDMKQGEGMAPLGPAYFASQRIVEGLMEGADAEPFKAVVERCSEQIREAVYEYVEDHLMSDLESNIQSRVWRMVDDTVNALLTGEQWAMQRYPYNKYTDGQKVREAVAKHGGDALLMARIADLEEANKRLHESLSYRSSY